MATAFTVELIIAAILIIVPLLSTGVIPVMARTPPIYTPIKQVTIAEAAPTRSTSSSDPVFGASHTTVVMLASNKLNQIIGPARERTDGPIVPNLEPIGNPNNPPNNVIDSNGPSARPKGPPRIKVSVLSEARLIHKVEPVYPRIANITGIRGEVKLHALIARDGTIQSLNVTSGHPLLAAAALEAVRQWKYQPYILNGDAVEVETFISVNFKRAGD